MSKKKLRKYSFYYLLLWIAYLICIIITRLTGLSVRPIVVLTFRLVAYFYPVIIIGYSIWNIKDEESFRNICFGIYLTAAFIITLVFIIIRIIPLRMERGMECGYLQITDSSNFPEPDQYFYAEPTAFIFMEYFQWDAEHDIHFLEETYDTSFTLAEDKGDDINRYHSFEHPEIAVRIYYHELHGSIDDYQYQLTSNIARKYCQDQGLSWEYKQQGRYEGNICFILHDDDLEYYALHLAAIITEALQDPFYKSNVGWISIELNENECETIYFGDYALFKVKGLPSDFYSESQNVLELLKKGKKIF